MKGLRVTITFMPNREHNMKRFLVLAIMFALGLVLLNWSPLSAGSKDKVREASARAAQDYIKHGLILATENRHADAVKSFQQAISLDPKSAEAYSLLGSALAKAGKYREAEEALRKAVALDPNYGEGYYYLGLFLKERGKEKEAEEAFRKAQRSSR
jgi:tetratricopeptide (TPR) repeat protein